MNDTQPEENMQYFQGQRGTGEEYRHAEDARETQKSDIQNEGKVKNHVAECRLIETG